MSLLNNFVDKSIKSDFSIFRKVNSKTIEKLDKYAI